MRAIWALEARCVAVGPFTSFVEAGFSGDPTRPILPLRTK